MQVTISEARDKATNQWMEIDGVVGVGESEKDGNKCIVVGVSVTPVPAEVSSVIPATFMGFPVVIEHWGVPSTQSTN